MLIEVLLFTAILGYFFYRWATANNDFFEKRGIPYQKPFFLLGGMKPVIFRKKSFFDMVVDMYRESDAKIYGFFDQRNPMIVIKDPEIIKQITVKDFDHFVNHRSIFSNEDGDLFSSSLFLMKDSKWKDMRSTLTPVFTGSKIRHMFELMNEVAQNTVEYLKREAAQNKQNDLDIDIKDYCTRFTSDIIASTAFGIKVNSLEEKKNQFYTMGKKVTVFTAWQNIKFFMLANFKPIMKLLKITLFDKKQSDYFMRLVLDAMKYRKEHNIYRPDMIQLMMEARGVVPSDHAKGHNREWTDVDVVAQCFLFFFAGFETSSVLMCFAAHEVMENPDVQKRLLEEIEEVNQDLNGKPLTYEKLMGMKYLDMVINETLRKWPGAIALDRVCNKDFLYEKDGERFEVKAGEAVWIPVCGFHRDPKYFENPEKFDPERFSDENKDQISPFVFMPFGVGPRNCIGNRFALLESKAILFYLLRDFRIEAAEKTMIPIELVINGFQMQPKTGFWLKLISRTQS